MKKIKQKISSPTVKIVEAEPKEEQEIDLPLDVLNVKVFNLRLYEDDNRDYLIKISFCNRDILTDIVKTSPKRNDEAINSRPIAEGNMSFSPADYEEMSRFADYPLIVLIQPYKSLPESPREPEHVETYDQQTVEHEESCCNIDILPLFVDQDELMIRQNLEPSQKPNVLQVKSWNLLPQIELKISITRDSLNASHHEILKLANHMQITLLGAYNMLVPYDSEFLYTAATRLPVLNKTVNPLTDKDIESNTNIVTFNGGRKMQKHFDCSKFYSKWESLRTSGHLFTKCDEKLTFNMTDLHNPDNIEVKKCLSVSQSDYTTLWRSFHRHLILGDSNTWLAEQLCRYKWPLEMHLYSEHGGYSLMAFLNLFPLLYPGETTINLAVPLQWVNSAEMMISCGCELLLTPNEAAPNSTSGSYVSKKNISLKHYERSTVTTDEDAVRPTGFDHGSAFVLIQVRLAKPFKEIMIPRHISQNEIDEMLRTCEQKQESAKWECTGRGHRKTMWQQTVESAAESLRNVPFYGKMEFCSFNRQLSESRTRVELFSSFCQDAAIYVNNNFVVKDFLKSDEAYEELIRMGHACLLKLTSKYMLKTEDVTVTNPVLKAARHARQLQDVSHAKTLFLQVVTENPNDANNWRELATCYRDVDKDYASACLDQSILLNPRHPLTLLSKAGMLFEEDPDAADIFFVAILCLYPFWTTGWIIANAYYSDREMHHVANEIVKYNQLTMKEEYSPKPIDPGHPRTWERELGDWWDTTILLPGQTVYYDAADLLLRLRAIALAEVCLARSLCESGETPQYIHLVALCCRLRGDVDDALCHLDAGMKTFGIISYLIALETECRHQKKNCQAALLELDKVSNSLSPFSILMALSGKEHKKVRPTLVDLIRRHPSAYAWMALADDWMKRASTGEGGDAGVTDEQTAARDCAAACAVQALRIDRRAARAWALLARLTKPRARRIHCRNMAIACGYKSKEHVVNSSHHSICHYVGVALKECLCETYLNTQ